ncbi:MAG: ATP-binding cassette domain-containing protein, partial [Bacteroidetes bacterium]|nr:ATP-binding cassette domain-containing protein [Bacteroidota bacterium]
MADKTHTTYAPFQRLVKLLADYRKEIRYILLYALVAGLINLSLPLGVQALIGLIAGGRMSASWGVLVLFICIGAMMVGFLRLMQLSVMEYMQRRIFTDSAIEFAVRIPRLNLDALRNDYLPELVNRFFDTLTLQKGLPKLLMDGSTALLQILLSLTLLSFYHSSFVFFSLLLLGGLIVLFYWTVPKGINTSLKESKYKYKLAYWLEEVGRVSETFKLAGESNFPLHRADELTVEYLNARAKHWRILLIQFAGGIVFKVVVMTGFLILGSLLVMNNELNLGQFVAAEILILFVVESVEKLVLLYETGYDLITAAEKLGQVADLPLEEENGIRSEEYCSNKPIAIELRGLHYNFEDGKHEILKNINLHIEGGTRVAVAGYNASGKSTLMQIISLIRRDYEGSLIFNGLPEKSLHLRSLRNQIGDLSSQEDLFKGTIRENLTMGNPKIPLQRLLMVIEQVGLTEFIHEQNNGLDTEILPAGKNIPGSIITKLLVARAILPQPKLLVMESMLSNLNF